MLTVDQLLQIMPNAGRKNAARFVDPLNSAMAEYEINTPARQAAFLGQIGHESGQLQYVREIWGPTEAQKKYEGRKDLGNTWVGDGHRYLGRAFLQVTGRSNYEACGKALGLDLILQPYLLEEPINACRASAWFWQEHNINKWADIGDFDGVSDAVNRGHKTEKVGDANGYADRKEIYDRALKVMGLV